VRPRRLALAGGWRWQAAGDPLVGMAICPDVIENRNDISATPGGHGDLPRALGLGPGGPRQRS
jgi:hypothetical protein